MFRSSPVSSFFLFASSSPSSTPSLSNFTGVSSRNRHDTSSQMKSTLPHKLITIALTINTISLILCVCVIIVVIALTMTLNPSKSAFTYNHSLHNSTSFIRQPNFIFTSVYPLISKVSFNAFNMTQKSPTVNATSQPLHSKVDAYKSNSLVRVKGKSSSPPPPPPSSSSNVNLVDKSNLIHHRRRGEPVVPLLHPHLPILTTISPEIQALEQAYGQILAILPLFIISSLLGVSASAKSSTTGSIILYWVILTATLLISTYITSNFVEYENLFALVPSDSALKSSRITSSDTSFIHTNDIITDSVDDTVTDDEDDFDDIYSDGEDDKDESSSVANSQSQVESVARIIVVIGALQMISAIILTLAKFHKTRVAIKDASINDLSRFNNPINMTNIDHNIISTNNRRLSSRATIETSLQQYPDDSIDLINHSVHSSPSMSLHHYNHLAGTSAFNGRSSIPQNVTSFSCNSGATAAAVTPTAGGNSNNRNNSVKTIHLEPVEENNLSATQQRFNNLSSHNSSRASYFTTQGTSEMNNFANYSSCMYANRVTLPEDILPIVDSVTRDSGTSAQRHFNVDNNINVYNGNAASSFKVNSDCVKISLPETRSS